MASNAVKLVKYLNLHELQLHHLQLKGLGLSLVRLTHHIGSESRAKGQTVRVHPSLLLREAITRAIDSRCHGHGSVMVIRKDVGGRWNLCDLIIFFVGRLMLR